MEMLVAEDVLLLLLDDDKGTTSAGTTERLAVGGALLAAIGQVHKVVDRDGLSTRELRRRAKMVAEGGWASEAVRDAVQAMNAATTAALAAAAAAAGSSS